MSGGITMIIYQNNFNYNELIPFNYKFNYNTNFNYNELIPKEI